MSTDMPSGTWRWKTSAGHKPGLGIGAQFGGKYFCLDVRVIRLPRHGASCPIGMGVSCSADRNIKGKITREGIFLERLETDPVRYLPEVGSGRSAAVRIDLDRPIVEVGPNSANTRSPPALC